jgi:TFIIF-interacting CTD phosphatase-like protein
MGNIVEIFCVISGFVIHFGSDVSFVFLIANKPAIDNSMPDNQKHMNPNLVIGESRKW